MPGKEVIFGVEPVHVRDVRESLQDGLANTADFIVVPLFHPRFQRDDKLSTSHRIGPGSMILTLQHAISPFCQFSTTILIILISFRDTK